MEPYDDGAHHAAVDDSEQSTPPEPETGVDLPGEAPHEAAGPQDAFASEHAASDAEAPHATRIEINLVAGDLRLSGGASEVYIHAPGGPEEHRPAAGQGVLRFADLPHRTYLRVPDGVEIFIHHVQGDLRAEDLDALLIAHTVGGDVELDRVAVCDLNLVDGDVSATRGGSLRAIAVSGDAQVEEYEDVVMFGSVGSDLRATALGELVVREALGGDCTIERCGAVTLLGSVGGDLRVERASHAVRAQAVGGDTRLSGTGDVTLATIGGDFKADGAAGAVAVSGVGGDARIRAAQGPVRLGSVGGDFAASDVPAGITTGHVGGDATLDTALGTGAEYAVHAAGDISLRVRGEINARFVAQAFGGEVRTHLPLAVEKGRRRNLVGALGTGSATITLRSDRGDILITGAEYQEKEHSMGDEYEGKRPEDSPSTGSGARTWEGSVGGQRFRVRWDRGRDRAGFHFQGPVPESDDPDAQGGPARDFNVEWERGRGARAYGEYEQRLRDLGERAERLARRTAEQAQEYAEKAARRYRETDWEAVGRDVRGAIEKGMADLEDAFGQVRNEWESRRPGGTGTPGAGRPTAQRVRIEHDEDGDAAGDSAAAESATAPDAVDTAPDRELRRRDILEQLRVGTISIEEAERRLNDLR